MHNEHQYLTALQRVLYEGTRQSNRTGTDSMTVPGHAMYFDMAFGPPIVTTKKFAFKACRGELICMLQGKTSAADFRAMDCNIWDANANKNEAWLANPHRKGEDDLGPIYGDQWRNWRTYEPVDMQQYMLMGEGMQNDHHGKQLYVEGEPIDQVLKCLDQIRNDPTNRRILFHGWNVAELHKMALVPCHLLYQFIVNVEKQELNLVLYQRSCDMFLGVPFNMASATMMLHLFAKMTGLRARYFTHFLADAHIYVNHIEQVQEQLRRTPMEPPELSVIVPGMGMFDDDKCLAMLNRDSFSLHNYTSYGPLKAEMAV